MPVGVVRGNPSVESVQNALTKCIVELKAKCMF